MVALLLAPVYILVNGYVAWRLLWWFEQCYSGPGQHALGVGILAIYVILACAIMIGFFLPEKGPGRYVKHIGNHWLGVQLFTLETLILAEVLRLVLKATGISFPGWAGGTLCLIAIVSLSAWGLYHSHTLKTTEYSIEVPKDGGAVRSLKAALVADFHLGYNAGHREMEKMSEIINRSEADLVLIAGDIYDNSYHALDDPDRISAALKSIRAKYGVFACYGNHDIEEKILAGFTFPSKAEKMSHRKMDRLLKEAGIRMLLDEGLLIDDSFYLYGRRDYARPGHGVSERKKPAEFMEDMDRNKPVIVLDHQPKKLKELADAGVDVHLAGHTHDGQMAPGKYVTALMWENSYGYIKKDNMHSIVTSGVGAFGPNMRIGTTAEVCMINIRFGKGVIE